MRGRKMGAVHADESNPRVSFQTQGKGHGHVVEEIEGLIRLYKDGRVDRLPAVADVPCTSGLGPDLMSWNVALDNSAGVWARIYLPKLQGKLPLLVYFHGGGFCVGSAAWSCYHDFLIRLATTAGCAIVSVNYRLAPEHRLPAAYQDGLTAMTWVRQQASDVWWRSHVDFNRVFLCGDSAGAAIAFNVAVQLGPKPVAVRGLILIQPFFGGESRTASERNSVQSSGRSALTLAASDAYWRMALPAGSSRESPWCNPLSKGSPRVEELRMPPLLVFISEMDILKDRNLEFCKAMRRAGKSVEHVVYGGVGHAFQILHNHQLSKPRTHEMLAHIKAFVNK